MPSARKSWCRNSISIFIYWASRLPIVPRRALPSGRLLVAVGSVGGLKPAPKRLLDLINKGTRVEEIESVLQKSAAVGISNLGLMIFGLPTSTEADLDLTLEFLSRTYPNFSGLTASAFVLFEKTYFSRHAGRFGMQVDHRVPLMNSHGKPVSSYRLKFREIASDGSLRPPCGATEVARWQQFRKWLGDPPLLEQLPTEHYLIHVSASGSPLKDPSQVKNLK